MTKELRDRLEADANEMIADGYPTERAWGMQEGVLISAEEAKEIIQAYDTLVWVYKELRDSLIKTQIP